MCLPTFNGPSSFQCLEDFFCNVEKHVYLCPECRNAQLQSRMRTTTNGNPVLANFFSKLFCTLLFEMNPKESETFHSSWNEVVQSVGFSSSRLPFPSFNYDYSAIVFDWMFFCVSSVFCFLIPLLFSPFQISALQLFNDDVSAKALDCDKKLRNQRKRSWVGARTL